MHRMAKPWYIRRDKKRIKEQISNFRKFITGDIWRISLDHHPKKNQSYWIKTLRIILLAIRGFKEDNVAIRASALTFFTTIAIVPVFAMFFGIAKGFGMDKNLDTFLRSKFEGQEEVLTWIMNFANSLIEKTVGGLMAGVGFIILLWSILRVFTNIEMSFNAIWHLDRGRNLTRKFSDYFSLILVAPILLIASSSTNVYLATTLNTITKQYEILGYIAPIIMFLLKLAPYLLVGVLFTILYLVMPNTKVHFKSALIAGIVAGTAFELVQWGYIYFQVGVSRYNAIYGSFAALPLFMVWQQISWIIVLVGAEISFAIQNSHLYEYEYEIENVSSNDQRTISVLLMNRIIKRHVKGDIPYTSEAIADDLQLPVRLVRLLLSNLVKGNLLVETYTDDPKSRGYVPAISDEYITVCMVFNMLDHLGVDDVIQPNIKTYTTIQKLTDEMNKTLEQSALNKRILDLE
jgi:Predicted membrane protein